VKQLPSEPDGREVAQLYRKRPDLIDGDLGEALVQCLRVAEMIRREPQSLRDLQSDLRCSRRTLYRHIARLRRAGYGIRFRHDLNAYVTTGLDWSQSRRTA
jgi:DNA-binding Lrp family transcriptional regulator